jgi:hypothetical protein
MFSTLASKLRRLEAVFACPKTDFHLLGGIRSKNQAVLKSLLGGRRVRKTQFWLRTNGQYFITRSDSEEIGWIVMIRGSLKSFGNAKE